MKNKKKKPVKETKTQQFNRMIDRKNKETRRAFKDTML